MNGFDGKSGVAEYGHSYITFGSGSANVTFDHHSTQSTMKLEESGNAWTTSAAPETLPYVTAFEIIDKSVAIAKSLINDNNAEFNVNWMNPSDIPDFTEIPLRYDITCNGQTYPVKATDGSAYFTQGHMWITADNSMDQDDVGIIRIEQDGNGIEAGIYQFSVFAPDADGGEIQQNFTLIVTDDSAGKDSHYRHGDGAGCLLWRCPSAQH